MININSYNKVSTLKILHSLKNHKENEIMYCEENSQLYQWRKDNWNPLEIKNNGLKMNLYDLNKNIINQLDPLSSEDLSIKTTIFQKFIELSNNSHYMLLCSEYNYYTIFELNNKLPFSSFDKTVLSILSELGEVYSLEETEDKTAIEIWIKPKDKKEPMAFYLFPYDQGVVYYG